MLFRIGNTIWIFKITFVLQKVWITAVVGQSIKQGKHLGCSNQLCLFSSYFVCRVKMWRISVIYKTKINWNKSKFQFSRFGLKKPPFFHKLSCICWLFFSSLKTCAEQRKDRMRNKLNAHEHGIILDSNSLCVCVSHAILGMVDAIQSFVCSHRAPWIYIRNRCFVCSFSLSLFPLYVVSVCTRCACAGMLCVVLVHLKRRQEKAIRN